MKRTHSIEIIEPVVANKRVTTEIVIDNDSSDSIRTVSSGSSDDINQRRYNRQEVKELFTKLRSMFPTKSDVVINNTIQRNLNNLDINILCNALIEDKSGVSKQDVIILNNSKRQPNQATRPTTSSNASIEDDLDKILQIVTDCDPDYIRNELKVQLKRQNRADYIVANLIEKKNYPRLKDKLLVSKKENKLESYLNMDIGMEDFLKIYPQPFEYFKKGNLNKNNTDASYKEHCRIYLLNKFSKLSSHTVDEVLKKNSYYFYPSIKQILEVLSFKGIIMKEVEMKNQVNLQDVAGGGDHNNPNHNRRDSNF